MRVPAAAQVARKIADPAGDFAGINGYTVALKRAGKLHVAEELYIGCAGFGVDIDLHGGEVFALPGIEVGVFVDEIVQHLRVGLEPDRALRGLLAAGGEREHERQGQDK